jgi:hypothetical protein
MEKLPKKDDLSTTPYGRKLLELANMILQRAKEEKDVPKVLQKYWAGPGRSFVPVSDRAYWLDDDQREQDGPWINALQHIDRNGDKKPLLALLRSDRQPSRSVCVYLADLLERFELGRPPHRPRSPAYERSDAETKLALAKEFVRNIRKSGMSFKDAVAIVANDWSLDENTLANYCDGRRGSSRRREKRHPPLSP